MSTSRLMIIDPGVQLWGSERALAATLKMLSGSWSQVILVTPPGAELARMVSDSRQYGAIRLVQAPIGMLHRKGVLARAWAAIRLAMLVAWLRPDRIYLNQAGLCRLLAPIARIAQVPLAIHVRLRDDLARVGRLRGSAKSPLHLIYISDAMVADGALGDGPYTNSYNAYDPYVFKVSGRPGDGKAGDFVYLGRLSHEKGPHLLVDALSDPDLARVGATVHFFGEGVAGDDYLVRVLRRAEELSLGERAAFPGFRQDVVRLLGGYRFLVSTSRYESLGRVVMEAWEAGLVPIVYAGSGGAAELVRKSGSGLLFDEWTSESLAAALQKALSMPEERRRVMAEVGLRWGMEHLSLARYEDIVKPAILCPSTSSGMEG